MSEDKSHIAAVCIGIGIQWDCRGQCMRIVSRSSSPDLLEVSVKVLSMRTLLALTVAISAIAVTGCATTQDTSAAKPTISSDASSKADKDAKKTAGPSKGGSLAISGSDAPKAPIYFDFDSEQLRPESQDLLKKMAKFLSENPTSVVTIEGHCDDLGSAEYNLALGDKRARQAKEYLTRLGIEDKRVQVVSFGEEKPAVENASDDAAREKNRRDEFELNKKSHQG